MKNIIIFGASLFAKRVFNYYEENKDINILFFCDNNTTKHNTLFCNKKVLAAEKILEVKFDEIIIGSMYDEEITKQLLNLGIDKKYIKLFHSNYNELQLKNEDNLKIVEELMFNISEQLIKHKIEYHIDHGTLLGIIRDKMILPWDIDVDFAVPSYEKDKILVFLKNYLDSYESKYCSINNWKYSISSKLIKLAEEEKELPMVITIYNDISKNKKLQDLELDFNVGLDLALKYEDKDKLYWMVAERRLSSFSKDSFPSKEIIFKEKILKIPKNEISYLENLYGNWQVTEKEWHYSKYSNIDYHKKA